MGKSTHRQYTISNWKKYGLICRECETYDDIYDHVMSMIQCELCSVEFDETFKNQRCMDHDHDTNYFRKVLCRGCNANYIKKPQKLKRTNKTGHMWIIPNISKNRNGSISVAFRYQRKGFKRKQCLSITKLICLSFINIIKKPT
tara:strand:- start:569 stop:1000 length:432 start_codon:yes stop_codon:yes gene_type:complete